LKNVSVDDLKEAYKILFRVLGVIIAVPLCLAGVVVLFIWPTIALVGVVYFNIPASPIWFPVVIVGQFLWLPMAWWILGIINGDTHASMGRLYGI